MKNSDLETTGKNNENNSVIMKNKFEKKNNEKECPLGLLM
jgi:hypothetical protein